MKAKLKNVGNFDKCKRFSLNRNELGNLKGGEGRLVYINGKWVMVYDED